MRSGTIRLGSSYPLLLGLVGVVLAASVLMGGLWGKAARTPAPAFALTDQRGQAINLGNLRDRVVVLTFLYTHCPDTCPLYLLKINQALTALGAPNDSISMVVVTVDPSRDTVDRLRDFTASWPANWHFLTGPLAQVAQVWEVYGVYVAKEETSGQHADHESYGVIHTAKAVIVDREGYTATELKGDWTAAELQQDLAKLLGGERLTNSSGGLFRPLMELLQRCGEFASSHPWAFIGLTLLLMLPGLALPAYLLRIFLHTNKNEAGPTL